MKKLFTLLIGIILFVTANAQTPQLNWAKNYNGPNNASDRITDADFDAATGYTYVTGVSDSTVGYNYVTIKYSSAGQVVWRKRYSGPQYQDSPNAIKYDPVNNAVYVTGKSKGKTSNFDWLTIRYNAATGDTVWTKRYNGTQNGNDEAIDLDIDALGNVFVVGNVLAACDNHLTTKLIKYSPDRAVVWTTSIENNFCAYDELANKVAVNGNKVVVIYNENQGGNYYGYAKGYFISNGDCTKNFCASAPIGVSSPAPGSYSIAFNGLGNVYIAGGNETSTTYGYIKITKLGTDVYTQIWQRGFGSADGSSCANNITVDENNKCVYVTGYSANSSGNNDIITMKCDDSGQLIWSKIFNGVSNGADNGMFITKDNLSNPNIFVVGYTTQSSGKKQITTIKYDTNGNQLWTIDYGCSTNDNVPASMFRDLNDNIYIAGYNNCNGSNEDYLTLKYCTSAPAQPGAITGNTTVCNSTSQTYSISPVPGAINYTWIFPSGWSGTSITTSITVIAGAISGNISVVANGSVCSSPARTLAVTANITPATPSAITGSTTVCSGASQTYSISPVTGATSYIWTLPSGATGTSITNSITVNYGASAVSGNITVKGHNDCADGAASTLAITVKTSPVAIVAIAATSITSSGFSANWNASANATGYYLDVATDNAFTNFVTGYQNKEIGNVTAFSVTGLTAETTYYYRVKASNCAGTSGVSNTINAITPKPSAILTLGNITGATGTNVSIPVSAINFTDVVGFQFTIEYDKTKLDFVNCTNWVAGINASNVQINTLDDKLTFVYTDVAINITNGKFFDLNFTIKANATGTAALLWIDTPTLREISNSQAKEVPCNYNNGTLSIVIGFNLSGQLLYENTVQTPLNKTSLSLLNSNNQSIATATTDDSGNFLFPGISNGNYTIKPDVKFVWGGVTAMDITSYKKHIGNVTTLGPLQVKSGDVNGSNSLTSMDLTVIKQRIGAQIAAFTVGDWVFDQTAIVVNGLNLAQNIKALCYGDANGSYLPSTLKSSSNMFFANNDKINLLSNGEFGMPFKLNKSVSKLSSVTLLINYPAELFDVKDIKMIDHNEDLYYSVAGGKITVVYSTLSSLDLNDGDLLMTIQFSLKKDASLLMLQNNQLELYGTGEFGDYDGKVLDQIKLSYATNNFATILNEFGKDEIKVYPNPARNILTVTNVSNTKMNVIDMLGRSILSIDCKSNNTELDIHSLVPGTYTLKINKDSKISYRKFTVVK